MTTMPMRCPVCLQLVDIPTRRIQAKFDTGNAVGSCVFKCLACGRAVTTKISRMESIRIKAYGGTVEEIQDPTEMPICQPDGCGAVQVPRSAITVRRCLNADYAEDLLYDYHFRCPQCNLVSCVTVNRRIADGMVARGIKLITWRLPKELVEPKPSGQPFSEDDSKTFAEQLRDEAYWFGEFQKFYWQHPDRHQNGPT